MNLEYDPKNHTAKITLRSGAVVKIREDEDGDLEIRETTHRYLNVKPGARNTIYLAIEDPVMAPSVILVDRQNMSHPTLGPPNPPNPPGPRPFG
jgi:hypothetical protein